MFGPLMGSIRGSGTAAGATVPDEPAVGLVSAGFVAADAGWVGGGTVEPAGFDVGAPALPQAAKSKPSPSPRLPATRPRRDTWSADRAGESTRLPSWRSFV